MITIFNKKIILYKYMLIYIYIQILKKYVKVKDQMTPIYPL